MKIQNNIIGGVRSLAWRIWNYTRGGSAWFGQQGWIHELQRWALNNFDVISVVLRKLSDTLEQGMRRRMSDKDMRVGALHEVIYRFGGISRRHRKGLR